MSARRERDYEDLCGHNSVDQDGNCEDEQADQGKHAAAASQHDPAVAQKAARQESGDCLDLTREQEKSEAQWEQEWRLLQARRPRTRNFLAKMQQLETAVTPSHPAQASAAVSEIETEQIESEVAQPGQTSSQVEVQAESQKTQTDSGKEWEVEKLVGYKEVKGKPYYRVHWLGWAPSDDTWEPVQHLDSCVELVAKFKQGPIYKAFKRKVSKRKRSTGAKRKGKSKTRR